MTYTAADMAALREQGDLKAFLMQFVESEAPQEPEPAAPPPREEGHRPGAWPAGCSRPQAAPPIPAEDVKAALDQHREWHLAGEPIGNYPCPCTACQHLDQGGQR